MVLLVNRFPGLFQRIALHGRATHLSQQSEAIVADSMDILIDVLVHQVSGASTCRYEKGSGEATSGTEESFWFRSRIDGR